MKNLRYIVSAICFMLWMGVIGLYAQEPPFPPIPPPQKEEADHTAANEKLAKEIQKAIDALNEIKDAAKIEILRKIKKHVEDNKKVDPEKNLENAKKKAIKPGDRNPDWLDNLIKGWIKSLGIRVDPRKEGWKDLVQDIRVSRIMFEPILYEAGPRIDPHVHAYLTFETQPGTEVEFLNARFADPETGTMHWLVQNVPLLPFSRPQVISYRINVEVFGPGYDFLQCEYYVGPIYQTDPDFPVTGSTALVPEPTIYAVSSGSSDPALPLNGLMPAIAVHPFPPGVMDYLNRGCDVPNADLDSTNRYPDGHPVSNDKNACGPAAAANSLQWLIKQHPELAGDTTSLRTKLDSLKGYMNLAKKDTNGVRFDSMVVGKLTLIDKLKLPIRVKYQTKHVSGDVKVPLASTEPPEHTADNQGKSLAYPSFDWLKKEMDDGEDVEVQVGWYGPPADGGVRQRFGGHWVVATGYFSTGMTKGIYFKDDNDQINAGGTREEYGNWSPGEIPYLEGMTDGKGNIAIIESVVSESYDPTVTFDDEPTSMITAPWSDIVLTGERMKPGYPFMTPEINSFPWLPVGAGIVGVGSLVYILTRDKDDPDDCTFTASTQTTNSSCGLPNGTAVITTTPADDYMYLWSNGATTSSLHQLIAGGYSATVTRAGTNCTNVVTVTIANINPTFTPSITTTDAHCGEMDGSATVTVNPPGTYTFMWSHGSTTQNQAALAQGNYSLTVSAGGECTQTEAIVIGQLPFTPLITISSTPANCGVSDGTAVATVDPPGEYAYAWSHGESGAQVSGLPAGTYTVTVSIPGTTCSQETSVTIDELPASFIITLTTTPSGCGLSDGTATAVVDPPGNYEFAWSTGQTGPEATGLAAGTYSVTASITGTTCTQEASVTIDESPPTFTINVSSTPSGCGASDGTGTVNVDPAGEYTIAWSNGQTGPEATGLAAGTYAVTVSITGTTCTQEASVTVDESPPTFTINVSSTPAGCGVSDGTGTVTVDPVGEYTIAWSNGQTGPEATGLAAGTYSVTVSITGTTCMQEVSVTVDELPPAFTISFTTTPAGCGLADGSATVVPDPPGEYEYIWSEGTTGPQLIDVPAGEYSVTVTLTGTLCSNTASVMVEQTGGGFTATFSTDPADCGIANGSATITIDPPGEYSYAWSNGQTGAELQQVTAGVYDVTVTDMNACAEVFSVEIMDNPAEYISIDNTVPGNCEGGGEITFTLSTPGMGLLVVDVVSPQGSTMLNLVPGTYQLSAFMPVTSGNYTFTVHDEQIGATCTEMEQTVVPDNTPALIAADDFYSTPGGQPVSENALENDSGLNIQMTSVSDEFGGTVTFNASGDFTFIPDPGFSGEASFMYTVTDACGTIATAIVTIFVEAVACEFTIGSDVMSASCGLSDGSIDVFVNEPGDYAYVWDNGVVGPLNDNIPAGEHSVTITDLDLGCDLAFTINLPELPAEHISDIVIVQPSCSSPGEIRFTATTGSQNPLVMVVDHPNGTDLFFIDPGAIFLSDYVAITAGFYTVIVFDAEAGEDCSESFTAELFAAPMIEIIVEAVFPPSEPTAMDGGALIGAVVPGLLPYTVLLNGAPYSTAFDHFFEVGGLGVGDYTIQVIDAAGCMSNILMVTIPFPDNILSFGTAVSSLSPDASMPEHVPGSVSPVFSSGLSVSYYYRQGRMSQQVRFLYLPRWHRGQYLLPGWMEVEHRGRLASLSRKRFEMNLAYGLGLRSGLNHEVDIDPAFLSLNAASRLEIGKWLHVHAEAGVRGWKEIERPFWMVVMTVPFLR